MKKKNTKTRQKPSRSFRTLIFGYIFFQRFSAGLPYSAGSVSYVRSVSYVGLVQALHHALHWKTFAGTVRYFGLVRYIAGSVRYVGEKNTKNTPESS